MDKHHFRRKLYFPTKSAQILDGSVVFFSAGESFKVSKFSRKEKAESMYDALSRNQHPNIASVHPVFQVSDDPDHYFLPLKLLGKRLDEVLTKDKFIYRDIWITEFYRQLLLVLFDVLKFINIYNKIEWEVSISNIFVVELSQPEFILVGFKEKGVATSLSEQCNALSVDIIRKINEKCNWQAPPTEMVELFQSLESKTLAKFRSIAFSPVMMSQYERRSVVNNVGDMMKHCAVEMDALLGKREIANFFSGWKGRFNGDKDLIQLRTHCEAFHGKSAHLTSSELQPTACTRELAFRSFDPARIPLDFVSLPITFNSVASPSKKDDEPYNGLFLFRQAIAHEMTTQALPTVEDVMHRFESTFPDVLLVLTKFGRDLENSGFACSKTLVPRKDALEDLFVVPKF